MRSLLARVCSRYVNTAVWSCRQSVIRTQPLHSITVSAARIPQPKPSRHLELSLTSRLVSTRSMATGSDAPPEPKKSLNRLAHEKSPYLLQHASNPVDWYPWGEEAFEKARSENKPIFLSVGYSTCHWCHVMERESFENQEIGKILSEHFVSIKVDREERPDVDKVYMTYIQATQGGGGWPMSVFLTPELEPFTGGTYFPPKDQYGRPGFPTLLKAIAEQWKKDNKNIRQKGSQLMQVLRQIVSVSHDEEEGEGPPGSSCIQQAYQTLNSRKDSKYGGFGSAPKFPQPVLLGFLLNVHARYLGSDMGQTALEMVLSTLKAMANGGIYDHVGQGFHRYSTDEFWHVPHFEKMLCDQALLACIYLEAYQVTKDNFLADVAHNILLYVSRDLTDQEGGFYSAEDADSLPLASSEHKKEGAFCVWTSKEISSLLPSPLPPPSSSLTQAHLFSYHYGVEPEGNVPRHKDPHGELTNQNVLIVRGSVEKTAEHFKLSVPDTEEQLSQCREQLAQARGKRPKPHRDDKLVTAWNGLTISAFAYASQVLDNPDYLKQATRAAQFVRSHLFNQDSGLLLRNAYRDSTGFLSVGSQEGFADDYSFLIRGLLDLFEASQDQQWLQWAWQLQEKQNELFWDEGKGGYFNSTANDPSILLRVKDDQDGSEPSPNSTSASNLHRLSCYLDKKLHPSASHVYTTFREMLTKAPIALCGMLESFVWHQQTPKQIIIAGERDSEDTKALLKVVHSFFLPNKVLILHTPSDSSSFLSLHLPSLSSMKMDGGKATAYVCENFTCSAPVSDGEKLKRLIDPARHLRV